MVTTVTLRGGWWKIIDTCSVALIIIIIIFSAHGEPQAINIVAQEIFAI